MISRLTTRIGLDAGVSFAALTRGWGVLGAVVTIWLVVRSFSPILQGYWYGFFSLLVLQQLFQMGLTVVVQQFASHEWAHLRAIDGSILGERSHRSRLASLIRLSRQGFRVMSVVVFVGLVLAGHLMFGGRGDMDLSWIEPWYALSFAAALSMLVLPMSAILDGTGNVAPQHRAQFVGGVAGSVAGWVAILAGMDLYSVAVIVGVRSALVALMLARPYRPFARLGLDGAVGATVGWKELWPLQWRLTLTWLTGALMYQSMVPLTFILVGPVAAGQMGVLNQVLQAVIGIGGVWLVSAQPRMGQLAAMRRHEQIRRLTRATAIRSSATAALVGVSALSIVIIIDWARPDVSARFGSPWLVAVLVLTAVAMQPTSAMVAAVRFQKKEPFILLGVVSAAVSIGVMALGATWFGLPGVANGFAGVVAFLIIPWSVAIYRKEMAKEEARGSTAPTEKGDGDPSVAPFPDLALGGGSNELTPARPALRRASQEEGVPSSATDGTYARPDDGIRGRVLRPSDRSSAMRALFLDRDGVIVKETGYLGRSESVQLIRGASEAIARANRLGVPVVVVTNQAGIGRGRYDWTAFESVNREMNRQLAEEGAWLDAIYACPFHPEALPPYQAVDHPGRKPEPGMLLRAAQDLNLDLRASWIVGDTVGDILAGRRAHLAGAVLVLTGHGSRDRDKVIALRTEGFPVMVASTLGVAARTIPVLAS